MRRRRKSRRNSHRKHRVSHRRHAYNRKRTRRNRGGRGKYSSFVKKHKGLFKRLGFKAASRKIGQMWRSKH